MFALSEEAMPCDHVLEIFSPDVVKALVTLLTKLVASSLMVTTSTEMVLYHLSLSTKSQTKLYSEKIQIPVLCPGLLYRLHADACPMEFTQRL